MSKMIDESMDLEESWPEEAQDRIDELREQIKVLERLARRQQKKLRDMVRTWRAVADAYERPENNLRNGAELARDRRSAADELEKLMPEPADA